MHSTLVVLLLGVGLCVEAASVPGRSRERGGDTERTSEETRVSRLSPEDAFRQRFLDPSMSAMFRSRSRARERGMSSTFLLHSAADEGMMQDAAEGSQDDDDTESGEFPAPDPHRKNKINWGGCDCELINAQPAGRQCRITSPAPRGKYCFCTYVGARTCHGYAYDCPAEKMHMKECNGTCTSDNCCKNIPELWAKEPNCQA